jgi:hypothetical protein
MSTNANFTRLDIGRDQAAGFEAGCGVCVTKLVSFKEVGISMADPWKWKRWEEVPLAHRYGPAGLVCSIDVALHGVDSPSPSLGQSGTPAY